MSGSVVWAHRNWWQRFFNGTLRGFGTEVVFPSGFRCVFFGFSTRVFPVALLMLFLVLAVTTVAGGASEDSRFDTVSALLLLVVVKNTGTTRLHAWIEGYNGHIF